MINRRIPDVCLGADVMVGFPGERETEFGNTRALLQELPFSYFHVFPFSQRSGTAAVKMGEKVDSKVKKSRSEQLRRLSNAKRQLFYEKQLGKKVRVLMEERNEKGLFQGLTDNYVRVGVSTNLDYSNQFLEVAIESVGEQSMAIGTII